MGIKCLTLRLIQEVTAHRTVTLIEHGGRIYQFPFQKWLAVILPDSLTSFAQGDFWEVISFAGSSVTVTHSTPMNMSIRVRKTLWAQMFMLLHTGIISAKADELHYLTLYEDVAHWIFYWLEAMLSSHSWLLSDLKETIVIQLISKSLIM